MAASQVRVEFIETSRGGRHLAWNGYRYRQNNKRDTWISWKCILTTCKATICTRDDIPTKFGRDHNHPPSPAEVEGMKIISEVRSRARVEMTPIPSIYDEEITKLRDAPWDSQTREVASKLPTFSATKSAMYRARQKTVPPIPSTRQTIQLNDKFQRTTSGELFLQADDGDADRILIFASPDNVEHLCAAPDIYCDGTLRAPPETQQPRPSPTYNSRDVYSTLPRPYGGRHNH
ncbi:hypothetical protein FSP39_010262 [Pinctada imbricata]|uniref:FLYWCH-type domain-containing protein n=1 Tax=Pinctada imbricata TaxID=66713 RepID=A0AA89C9U9_PINIB|nr:hypothetical protein FSP39_010262 [Pinctada imbricata]